VNINARRFPQIAYLRLSILKFFKGRGRPNLQADRALGRHGWVMEMTTQSQKSAEEEK